METIRDAISELEESAQEAADASDGNSSEDSDGDDEDDFSGTISKEEARVVPGCVLLLRTCGSFTGQMVKIIEAINTPSEASTDFGPYNKWIILLHDHTRLLADYVDQLIASLYSPQVRATVLSRANTLKEEIDRTLTQTLKNSPFIIASPTALTLLAKLDQAVSGFILKAIKQIENPA